MPGAGVGSIIGGLLSGSATITQIFLWTVVGQVISALLAPYLTQAQYDVWKGNTLNQPTPPDLAEMALKTIISEGEGASLAALYGEAPDMFHKRVLNTGEPPGIEAVLQWARRGFLPFGDAGVGVPSVPEAIRTSRIRNEWTDVIIRSQWLPLTAADAVNAWVRHQIPEADARQYLTFNGLQPTEQTALYNTAGRPMAPQEVLELVRRGLVPLHGTGADAISFQQAIYEGDTKDKWEPAYENLIVRLPSAFDVRRMQMAGGITAEQAAQLYAELGLPQDVIAGLVAAGSHAKLATTKNLAQSTVTALYRDKAMSQADALSWLEHLGYDATEAQLVLEVVDLAAYEQQWRSAVERVRTAYLARRIDQAGAHAVLDAIGVDAATEAQFLGLWTAELAATVRVLTPAQVVDAVFYSIADISWALPKLQELGYSASDAWVLVSDRLHGPLDGRPGDVPAPPPPSTGGPTA